ncbi:MAG: hypothetical protein CMF38_07155 [Legionellaceae bacterium]|nr:hypothetical protein [Legionellaceae bacterium]|tara:strand:- start:142 stop:1977 length:1836 start_codon:yes stop_codon:yes gene_type:complete
MPAIESAAAITEFNQHIVTFFTTTREQTSKKARKNAYDALITHMSTYHHAANSLISDAFFTYHRQKLNTMHPGVLEFIKGQEQLTAQKDEYRQELQIIVAVLCYQLHLAHAYGHRHHIAGLWAELRYAKNLLNILEGQPKSYSEPAGYVGLKIALFFKKAIEQLFIYPTGDIRTSIGDINEVRLYWVWAGGMLSTLLNILAVNFFHDMQARTVLGSVGRITGYMSWILYFTRFGLETMMLLKHTLKGPWMSQEEQALGVPIWARFKTQWDARKFIILNDLIWGVVNLLCFFWLTGAGKLGYAGNVLTVGLLFMDMTLVIWRAIEQYTRFNQEHNQLSELATTLQDQLTQLKRNLQEAQITADKKTLQEEIRLKKIFLRDTDTRLSALEFEWTYQKRHLINDILYAASLIFSFTVVCCAFVPPMLLASVATPLTLGIIGCVGASLCFLFSLNYVVVKGSIDIRKIQALKKDTHNNKNDAETTLNMLGDEVSKDSATQLSQEIFKQKQEQYKQQLSYQTRLIRYKRADLVRLVIFETVVPAVVLSVLLFAPISPGIGMLVVGLGLVAMLMSKKLWQKFEPKPMARPALAEGFFQTKKPDSMLEPPVSGIEQTA